MCGILGFASQNGVPDKGLVTRMRDTMGHRGPDDAGLWCARDGAVALAHRRLAIIELSRAGHQPMEDEHGEVCVVLNGEIYNFRELRRELEMLGFSFRSSSDTEVLLRAYLAWGADCLRRLDGMFAFGVYDARTRTMFLARDRAGEKPCFYYHVNGTFVFASELKAMMADPAFSRDVNLDALNYYLAYGYVPADLCILERVRKLEQGQAALYSVTEDKLLLWRYWELPPVGEANGADPEVLADELAALLLDSVRHQLVADVPVGMLLSGGLDSSLVAAMASEVAPGKVRTFTISFPGYGTFDEAPYARLVANRLGTEHTELQAAPTDVDLLPALARQYDEPLADSSMVPTFLVSQLVRSHCTVALGGDGGDELFGGYRHYNWVLIQETARRYLPKGVRNLASQFAFRCLPMGFKGRNFLKGLGGDLAQSMSCATTLFDLLERRKLLQPLSGGARFDGGPEDRKASLCDGRLTALQQATRADFRQYLVDDILVKVDRASMLASLEVRAPWLDHKIIEFAFTRLPDNLRATRTERKILSRKVGERHLPSDLDLRRKQGFSIPLRAWFKAGWADYFNAILEGIDPNVFDKRFIRTLLTRERMGLACGPRLFSLVMFELWRREYKVSL